MLTENEVKRILKSYNLGEFKEITKVYKDDTISYGIRIKTNSHDLFLKEFHNFNIKKENSLKLISFLKRKCLPVINLFQTSENNNFINFNNKKVAIFEFLALEEKQELNEKEVFELAKNLAKLHSLKLPSTIKLGKNNYPITYCKKTISNHFNNMEKAPPNFKKVITYVYNYFKELDLPRTEPLGINHLEFTQEHTRFKENKLVAILDWDETNYDYTFYDIGNAILSCFDKDNFNFKKFKSFIKGYQSIKKFTSWQNNHLFELVHFGAAINCIWNLTNMKTGELSLENKWPEDIKRIEILMKIGKDQFFKIT
jgi:Ser/Thr protein kinase RdoA (MazF antagonist)